MDNSSPPPKSPTIVNRTVLRRPNAELRTREHLTAQEVESLIEAAGANRPQGHRDALMILLAFRHGLRASEVCDLRWEQVDFQSRDLACASNQGRNPGYASANRSGVTGIAQASAPCTRGSLRLCQSSVVPRFPPLGSSYGRTLWPNRKPRDQGPCPHVAPCLRLCPRK